MKLYIVEDEIFQLEDLKITVEKLGHDCVGSSADAFDALEEIASLIPDLALIDIHLNKREAGIQLAKKIKELYQTPIVFVTSEIKDETIAKAIEVNPIAYLTKPVKESDLKAALILAENSFSKKEDTHYVSSSELFVRSGNKLHKLKIDSILYAHTDSKNYCSIVTEGNKKFSVRNSVTGLLKTLNNEQFIQTHRSYLINWNFIRSFSEADQSIDLQGNSIPVGRTYKAEILKRLRII